MAKAAGVVLLVAALLGCLVSASLADQGTATYYTVYTRALLLDLLALHYIMNDISAYGIISRFFFLN
jgi:hypothetical protein